MSDQSTWPEQELIDAWIRMVYKHMETNLRISRGNILYLKNAVTEIRTNATEALTARVAELEEALKQIPRRPRSPRREKIMKFIKLTLYNADKPILVNLDNVTDIHKSLRKKPLVLISLNVADNEDQMSFSVKESFEEICEMIKELS